MATTENKKGKQPSRGGGGGGADGHKHTGKRKHPNGSRGAAAGPSKKKKTYTRPESLEGIPGAGKLKASIRQTNRLLAKPNLAPGTKIEAERRLATLTADLEKLQNSRAEKDISARYHKVKFFERQKLVRKIKQTKKLIGQAQAKAERGSDDSDSDDASDSEENEDGSGKASLNELQARLLELRCLLHYVLRYPPDLPYVSLFANGVKEPNLPTATEKDSTRRKAFVVLDKIRKATAKSELSAQPEVDLETGELADRKNKVRATDKPSAGSATSTQQSSQKKKATNRNAAAGDDSEADEDDSDSDEAQGVEGDDFFARDSEDEDDE